eukprot:tig00000037_g10088.t1
MLQFFKPNDSPEPGDGARQRKKKRGGLCSCWGNLLPTSTNGSAPSVNPDKALARGSRQKIPSHEDFHTGGSAASPGDEYTPRFYNLSLPVDSAPLPGASSRGGPLAGPGSAILAEAIREQQLLWAKLKKDWHELQYTHEDDTSSGSIGDDWGLSETADETTASTEPSASAASRAAAAATALALSRSSAFGGSAAFDPRRASLTGAFARAPVVAAPDEQLRGAAGMPPSILPSRVPVKREERRAFSGRASSAQESAAASASSSTATASSSTAILSSLSSRAASPTPAAALRAPSCPTADASSASGGRSSDGRPETPRRGGMRRGARRESRLGRDASEGPGERRVRFDPSFPDVYAPPRFEELSDEEEQNLRRFSRASAAPPSGPARGAWNAEADFRRLSLR